MTRTKETRIPIAALNASSFTRWKLLATFAIAVLLIRSTASGLGLLGDVGVIYGNGNKNAIRYMGSDKRVCM